MSVPYLELKAQYKSVKDEVLAGLNPVLDSGEHVQEVYRGLAYRNSGLPGAKRAFRETPALSLNPDIIEDTVHHVARTLPGD